MAILDPGDIPVFVVTCRTQEIHVYRKIKTGELAAGIDMDLLCTAGDDEHGNVTGVQDTCVRNIHTTDIQNIHHCRTQVGWSHFGYPWCGYFSRTYLGPR
jgi:hypothetical protein